MDIKITTSQRMPSLTANLVSGLKNAEITILFIILLLVWFLTPGRNIDQGICLLIILSLITFLLFTAIAYWLLHQLWQKLRLPAIQILISQFKTMEIWQQLAFLWGSFALLLLAALASLTAIC